MRRDTRLAPGDTVGELTIEGDLPCGYYQASHGSSSRVVLDLRDAADWRLVAVQMLRAATALESLDHPGVARIVAHGVLPDHRPWVASELVEGVTLADLMLRRKLTAAEVTGVVRDVADLLAFVHLRGIVHGNLRPQHIVLATGPRQFPIVIGGWAHLRTSGIPAFDDPPTRNVYVAPEHLVGAVDGRADVYTLGAIAYRALAGVFPDVASDLVAGEPGSLGDLIMRMLDRDPHARPTAAEVHATLAVLTADRMVATPHLPRPRWTPAPGVLEANLPPSVAQRIVRDDVE